MVAMKEVLPKCGPFFVFAFFLIPVGFLLVAFLLPEEGLFPLASTLGSPSRSSPSSMLLAFR
ncbi:putative transporter [Sesbania bispinosa]|nr:putative transporter [Sesbania bispinosa]